MAPDHLSLYILEVYPHLPLKQEIDRRGWTQQPDDVVADMYESAMSMLDAAGYEQYEISNVSRPGRRVAPQPEVLDRRRVVGFRSGRPLDVAGKPVAEYPVRRGVRSATGRRGGGDGRSSPAFRRRAAWGRVVYRAATDRRDRSRAILSSRYGIDVWERFGGRLAPFCDAGILLRQEGRLRLTRQGMLLANEVMSVFV